MAPRMTTDEALTLLRQAGPTSLPGQRLVYHHIPTSAAKALARATKNGARAALTMAADEADARNDPEARILTEDRTRIVNQLEGR